MRTKIYEIPNKLLCEWDSAAKAVIDTWETYSVTLAEFKEAVLIRGVNHAKTNGVNAWIVDSHKAKGVFSKEIQEFIGTTIFPTFARIGVKFFVTINSENALTNLTISEYKSKAGPNGLQLVSGSNIADSIEWVKKNSLVKQAIVR